MRIVFMGTPDFAVSSLDAICSAGHEVAAVVTVPDRQVGRGLKIQYSAVKEYALAHHLTVLQPEKLRDETFLAQLRQADADCFVVVAFRMLPQCVWAMPRLGTFNLHGSLLPQYRGAAPINWAIINGETETGVTTFLLNEHIDEGNILLQESIAIAESDTAESVHDRLAAVGAELVVRTLRQMDEGTLSPKPQQLAGVAKPAPKIFKEDCCIKWDSEVCDIFNFVRGLSPYPAALMNMTDDKGAARSFKVYEVGKEHDGNSHVGELFTDGKKVLKVGAADGFVHILSLQLSGKRRITVEEFLRGYDVTNWKIVL